MALTKQSYKGEKIKEIRWIYDKDNSANAMTKTSPNLALERII